MSPPKVFNHRHSKYSPATSSSTLREHRIKRAGGAAKRRSTAIALFGVGTRFARVSTPRIESVVASQGRPNLSLVTLTISIGCSGSHFNRRLWQCLLSTNNSSARPFRGSRLRIPGRATNIQCFADGLHADFHTGQVDLT
jgi:hypothetical protein